MPKVSVAIAAYNCARYIAEAIDSVLAQGFPSLEIIIVNDGSTDDTGKILNIYRKHPLIRVINQKHRGQGWAKDRAIKASQGRYIALLDADDIMLPQRINKQTAVLDKYPSIGGCYGKAKVVDENLNPIKDVMYGGEIGKPFKKTWDLIEIPFHPGTLMFRKILYKKTGGYHHSFTITPDSDFTLKLSEHAKFYFIDDYFVLYRMHRSNVTRNKSFLKEEAIAREDAIWRRYKRRLILSHKQNLI